MLRATGTESRGTLGMTSDASKIPDEIRGARDGARAEPPSDDPLARAVRGFGPLGLFAILVILLGNAVFIPVSAILVLVWVRLSHTPWREIGYVRERNWVRTVVVGIAFGVAFKLVMKAIVMPLLGAPPINQAYHYLAGNRAALPGAIT